MKLPAASSKNTAAAPSYVCLLVVLCGGGVVDAMHGPVAGWWLVVGLDLFLAGHMKSSSLFRVDLSRRNSYHGASTTSSAGSCRHHLTLGDMGEIFCDISLFYHWIWKVLLRAPKLSPKYFVLLSTLLSTTWIGTYRYVR